MAYTTGSANDFSELKIALAAFLTSNGWTDTGSGNYVKGQINANLSSTETPSTTNGLKVIVSSVRTSVNPGAHRYWRIYCATSASNAFSASEITLRETPAGSNVASGGTAIASDSYSSLLPGLAFDGNDSTYWGSNGIPAWIGYDLGAGNEKEILEFSYRVRPDSNFTQAPTSGTLQYSDDAITWLDSDLSWSGATWSSLETKVFTMPTPGSTVQGIPAPQPSVLAAPSSHASVAISWPVTYHGFLHDSPDEVVFLAVDGDQRVYHVAFGNSDIPHVSGEGMWQTGIVRGDARSATDNSFIGIRAANATQANGYVCMNCMPFWGAGWNFIGSQQNRDASYVYINGAWIYSGISDTNSNAPANGTQVNTRYYDQNLYGLLPNAWNSETVLLPYQSYLKISGDNSNVRLVLDFKSIRKCRVDNFENADIVDFAGDKWMVFSIYRKDSANRNGSYVASGTHGIAIKYDGP